MVLTNNQKGQKYAMLDIITDGDLTLELSDKLLNFISRQDLKNGDRLPAERALAGIFGVTRGNVRKAMLVLENLGKVERRRGAGTYVANQLDELDENQSANQVFHDVMEIRCIIEPKIAELACARRTAKQLDQLKIITCDHQKRLLTGQPEGDLDAQFHYCFAQCSGNQRLAEIMKWLNELYRVGRASGMRNDEWRQFSVNTHLRIIDALERRSVKECKAAVESHLAVVLEKHPLAVGGNNISDQVDGDD